MQIRLLLKFDSYLCMCSLFYGGCLRYLRIFCGVFYYGVLLYGHNDFSFKKKFSDILIDYNVTNDDISLLASYYEIFKPEISRFIDDFYTWMENKAFYREFFTKQNVLSKEKKAQLNHWHDLFSAEINDEYLEKRFIIGKRHAQINLPIDVYIAGMTYLNSSAKRKNHRFSQLCWN